MDKQQPRRKSPRLRTRDQITLQYKMYQKSHEFWVSLRELPAASLEVNPRLRSIIERNIAMEGAAMDALLFALNGVV